MMNFLNNKILFQNSVGTTTTGVTTWLLLAIFLFPLHHVFHSAAWNEFLGIVVIVAGSPVCISTRVRMQYNNNNGVFGETMSSRELKGDAIVGTTTSIITAPDENLVRVSGMVT